ncbi:MULTISPECIES: APC family permease [Loigolactobacillus]|uniref:Amino acid:proton symporter n=1 Tax=Loigolactobacillus backii TaxID=375175 RepID=A0A192H0E7_9LACO|nr:MULTISPECIES: APC family permease [Loigolactobacillus]ANK60296.1 amino acid:proton symporter [Loigolactobacillus backii]ANK62264.1 amino acid:proton symporter [Loigolactobacillus backii]ANK65178.1 amino acid:proton symporter [Loigolactobacillus backii]ANK67736.1 amino acid:proton symporter [Loigolactobacillus backii]ANK70723.1 amino acid:proton symporter [Loigolactobacillus backii]
MERQKMGLFSLVMLALSSIIGSGWLFGSGEAARVAGPAAIISWIIGAVVIITIAFNYVELGTMFPESGGMSRYAQYSHGPLLGFIAAWANWVSLVTIIPIEAVAAVQYMSSWPWSWASWTHHFLAKGNVTTAGLGVVFIFMLIFTLLNFWSVKLLTRFTSLLAIFKMLIPTLTILLLLFSGFHASNFGHNWQTFAPYGSSAIFEATTASGIIFSYNAFQTVINMGSEIERPHKNILRGIAISLAISAVIYTLLQVTFIGSVRPSLLARVGWHGLNFQSPFADLAMMLGLYWLSLLLYLDAFVSPFGTGVSFAATTARTLAAMTQNRHMPGWLGRLNRRYLIPRFAMLVDLFVSMLLVSVFRNWSTLASVISTSTLIAYLTGPVTAISLRKMRPNFKRPFKSKWLHVMAPLAFVLASLATYWAMWPTTVEVICVILLGLPFYVYYEHRYGWKLWREQVKGSLWLIVYLAFLSVVSFIGSKGFGGINWLHYPWDFLTITVVALIFYRWGIASRLDSSELVAAAKVNQAVIMPEDED